MSGSEDGKIYLWDMVTGMHGESTFQAHNKPVRSVASHPSENILISASIDGIGKVWIAKPSS